jgi:hypothetical protein
MSQTDVLIVGQFCVATAGSVLPRDDRGHVDAPQELTGVT